MTNVVALKSLKYIEWTVQTAENAATYVSKSFSLQGRTYYLELFMSSTSYLYFRSHENLQLPINVTVRVSNPYRTINVQVQTITRTNGRITYTGSGFLTSLLTFEVMILADPSKGEFFLFFKNKIHTRHIYCSGGGGTQGRKLEGCQGGSVPSIKRLSQPLGKITRSPNEILFKNGI